MTPWPTATRGRCAPASPCQLGSPCWTTPLLRPPAAMRTPVATTARAASTRALNGSRGGRVGIEPKIAGIGDGIGEPGGRGDPGRFDLLSGLACALDERTYDRALVARSQISSTALQLFRRQFPDCVQQR